MPEFRLAPLMTLETKPSWVNRAGRIDRSACVELRASDIWRRVSDQDWRFSHPPARGSGRNPQAFADFTLTASLLAHLHDARLPRHLAGDLRSRKSNAMKSHLRHHRSPIAINPNKGATRVKKLGVWDGCKPGHAGTALAEGWKQVIRIECWRLHDRLAQHFLICPRCGPRPHSRPARKHLKLFMPLAMQQEIDDARLAEGWIRLVDATHQAARLPMPRELAALRARLIDRYFLLFQGPGAQGQSGRELLCRGCLNIRYGEIKRARHARRVDRFVAANAVEDAHRIAAAAESKRADARAFAHAFARLTSSPTQTIERMQ